MPEAADLSSVDDTITAFVNASGLVAASEIVTMSPLTGGVASDIWHVVTKTGSFVVKKALSRLRVAREWTAPVSRNASEVDWLMVAGRLQPDAVPKILAHDASIGAFAMEYFNPVDYPVWKAELREGRCDARVASNVGSVMGRIHAATAYQTDIERRFANDETFHAIRLEPYLEATAIHHPDLRDRLFHLSKTTLSNKTALVHGDVSPKNILVGSFGPVILDAECAWYGDPAFDLAFCLNHLLLKCVWRPDRSSDLLSAFEALATAYFQSVDWEARDTLEARAAALLPALLLARVDGKSPVEYITDEADKARVRRTARPLIAAAPPRLATIKETWARELTT